VTILAGVAAALLAALTSPRAALAYEGYGYQTVGGQGGSTCHVTSLAPSGAGSFADCVLNRTGPRIVVFDVGGTIALSGEVRIKLPYLTIDGTTAPSPGITIRPADAGATDSLYIEATHDIIIRGLRLVGFGGDGSGGDLISIYGSPSPCYNIVVDHCSLSAADDGAVDITSDGHDITVSWCLLYNNNKTQLIKYGALARISIHHNVYASSPPKGERNPLVWGDVSNFDYVNNVIYGWYWYGLGIRHEGDGGQPGKRVNANIVNNLFTHEQQATIQDALIYGPTPGPDAEDGGPSGSPPQGTVVTGTNMGHLWVSGNILPPQNRDQYSTVSSPLAVPAAAQVTTWPASELKTQVLPTVGTVFRTSAEQALLVAVAGLPSLTINDVQVTEGNGGTTNAVFTVRLSAASDQVVTVDYATADGTARAPADYTATAGTLSFPVGATTRTVSVPVVGDLSDEPNETFLVRLSNAVGALVADAQGTGTIVDDDPPPVVSIGDVSVAEGETGTTLAAFPVSLSAPSGQVVSVTAATADGTAVAGSDYVAGTWTVVFPPGDTTETVNVAVRGDRVSEADETFRVVLSGPTNATLGDPQAVGTILNDDPPGLSITDVDVVEPVSGTRPAVFTVTLSPTSASAVTVNYATTALSATAGKDYDDTSGTLTFDPGVSTRPLSVTVHADAVTEGVESFRVNLTAASGAAIAYGQAIGRIHDPGELFTVVPCRVLDTRNTAGPYGGPALSAGQGRLFTLAGRCGIPASARSVSVNLTVTGPTARGNLRLYPAGQAAPKTSTLNYTVGQTRANGAVVGLSPSGALAVWCSQATGTAHVILDVTGYFE
jgi:pectate lyase